jgi:hypothetical protein
MYSAEFWRQVGVLHQLGFVPLSQLAEELGLDRKYMREKAREYGWTKTTPDLTIAAVRNRNFVPHHPSYTPESMQDLHDSMIEKALWLKTSTLDELYAAAEAKGIAPVKYLDALTEARRHV